MKNVLISGASRGLGRHLAKYFWNEGFSLILISRNLADLEVLRSDLSPRIEQSCDLIQCDFSDLSQIESLSDTFRARKFDVDVLINNAAVQGTIGDIREVIPSEMQRVFNVNLLAAIELCRIFLPGMKQRNYGSIINLAGGGGANARAYFHSYSASKAALIRFSENLALELNQTEIKVNCIAPGVMKTDMMKEILAAGLQKSGHVEFKTAENVMQSSDRNFNMVTSLIGFLASPASNGITGKLISAKWDNWQIWPKFLDELTGSDVYTLRRIVGRDRNFGEGDV